MPSITKKSFWAHLGKSPTSSSTLSSSWIEKEPPALPPPLSSALGTLVHTIATCRDRQAFAPFVDLAESPALPSSRDGHAQWKRVKRSLVFTLLKRQDEVLSLTRLDAHVEEVASILGATTNQSQAANMLGLYGNAFITGSVAYVEQQQGPERADRVDPHVAIKTANFVHSTLLGKNEQWCFAESLHRAPDSDSFILTQGSLSAHQAHLLPARSALNANLRRVAQLRDVTAAYLVERLPGSHGLRVVFHGAFKHEPIQTEGEVKDLAVSRKAARVRLQRLGQGLAQLSQLVRRRRFGVQVYADLAAFKVRNPRCTCCTRKFVPLVTLRTRCELCGYYVCTACATSEAKEDPFRLATVSVCTRCTLSVTKCNYRHMLTVVPGPERVVPDDDDPSTDPSPSPSTPASSTASRSSTTSSSSSQMLAELLGQWTDDDAKAGHRHAALTVLMQLMLENQAKTRELVEQNTQLVHDATELARQALDVSSYPANPDACVFASATARPYPLLPAVVHDSGDLEPMEYPIPANEHERLAAIEQCHLRALVNVPELNVICTLAAAEMKCPHSVITLVEQDVVTLLATNAPELWDVGSRNPRAQTFCQHFIMEDAPLLVRHAEADMRFYHITPVVMRSLRFYAGFPLSVMSADGHPIVVGALCCMDANPHVVTRAQYWRLMKLANAASEILAQRAAAYRIDANAFV
ncbi:hypothetical protein PsorP6_010406 [Peronosclerospora sorghi]|uniref:Uncharacterized protein n=1 Tax=Peronosclerospora sorghi TaxID=230839 RepID=A0ACC0VVU6_9STRA|nr:hypothetical protein PsorP6_010406 [Peronosclerospora sorghi]